MSSKDNTFKNKLYNILVDLNSIKSAEDTLQLCVQNKLNRSYDQYDATMKNLYNYVLSRSNIKVIKALTKMRNKKEKQNGN